MSEPKATAAQLDTLQLTTGYDWRPHGLTKAQATELLARLQHVRDRYGEAAAEAAAKAYAAEQAGADADESGAEGEGDGASDEGAAEFPEETSGAGEGAGAEGDGEGEQDEGDGDDQDDDDQAEDAAGGSGEDMEQDERTTDPLADAIVATVKRRRDEVLDGLQLGSDPKLAAQLADELAERLDELVREVLAGMDTGTQRKVVTVRRTEHEQHDVTDPHDEFVYLVDAAGEGDHVLLVGPAGTGKTHGAKMAAEALGRAWTYWPCNPRTTAAALMGFVAVDGETVARTQFREAYEHGKLFILDEMDNAAPDLLVALNGAIENGVASFPDGLVERHPDFVVVATANTYGKGANRIYSGRQQLDGATLDRFIKLDWGYDERLERKLAPCDDWTDFVQAVRAVVADQAIREVVSMRASIRGGRYIGKGWGWQKVAETQLFLGWSADALAKVQPVVDRFAGVAARYPAVEKGA